MGKRFVAIRELEMRGATSQLDRHWLHLLTSRETTLGLTGKQKEGRGIARIW